MRDSKVMLETPVQSIFGLSQRNIWLPFRVCDWRFGMYWEWPSVTHSSMRGGKVRMAQHKINMGSWLNMLATTKKLGQRGHSICPRVKLPMVPKLFLAFCVAALEAKCKHL